MNLADPIPLTAYPFRKDAGRALIPSMPLGLGDPAAPPALGESKRAAERPLEQPPYLESAGIRKKAHCSPQAIFLLVA